MGIAHQKFMQRFFAHTLPANVSAVAEILGSDSVGQCDIVVIVSGTDKGRSRVSSPLSHEVH